MECGKEILAVIPARKGSTGIPGKNLVDLYGKPLARWTIDAALAANRVSRVIVSTDGEKISAMARQAGAEVPFMRPAHLAAGTVHSVHAVLHALDWLSQEEGYDPDAVLMLLPTSPFRTSHHIDEAIQLYRKKDGPAVISVSELDRHMVNLRYIRDGALVSIDADADPNSQRQERETLYAINAAIYITSPAALKRAGTFHMPGALAYLMPRINSLDIDDAQDLELARLYAREMNPWD